MLRGLPRGCIQIVYAGPFLTLSGRQLFTIAMEPEPFMSSRSRRMMGGVGSTDQDLRGHAADVDTGASEGVAFDQGDVRTFLGAPSAPSKSPRHRCRG
jgi:hypothetical protein